MPTLDEESDPTKAILGAVSRGDKPGVKKALSEGADPNTMHRWREYEPFGGSTDERETLLAIAIDQDDEELVALLLDHGADPNLIDDHGTPLQHAASLGRTGLVRRLLESGADPGLVERPFPDTALDMARTELAWWTRRGWEAQVQRLEETVRLLDEWRTLRERA